jgi:hypothetical protein
MKAYIKKYGGRNWAVWLETPGNEPELVAVTLYKRGAESVLAMAEALIRRV